MGTREALARASAWEKSFESSGRLEFRENVVRKRVPGSAVAAEVEATNKGRAAAEASGLFHCPRVVAASETEGWIDFERVRGFVPLWQLLEENPERGGETLERAGAALAAIHASGTGGDVFLHGDFNTLNVGWREETGLVILDWSPRHLDAGDGSRYVDLAHFVYSLLASHRVPLSQRGPFCARKAAFLAGYTARTGVAVDGGTLKRGVLRLSRRLMWSLPQPGPWRRAAYSAMNLVGHGLFLTAGCWGS